MHHETNKLANQIQDQNEYWKTQHDSDCTVTNEPVKNEKERDVDRPVNDHRKSLIKVHRDTEGSINVDIDEKDFYSIPEYIRGRCKIDDIKHVAMFVWIEVTNRLKEGLRGNQLCIDRQNITKHTGGVPGLYSIIMNTSLWRDILSTLQYLNFMKLEKDGMITMISELG